MQTPTVTLTDQQQMVVNHNRGAALVFAVAGAGKTTAMVHRIERLVREGVFSAETILATSFGKSNERDLRRALTSFPHCERVNVSTLHALANDIVRTARSRGLLKRPSREIEIGRLDQTLLSIAMNEVRSRNMPFRHELNGIDRQDFLDYVGHCKSNLAYADLGRVSLPAGARKLAKQAEPPSTTLDWYLKLYQVYEGVRTKNGWITFDDMLMTGWELLHQYDALLITFQNKFDCVMVDEFQDINLAQSEILDLLTFEHRNYMAIGDDDQTIYQWRGAHPRYILDFPQRYNAKSYIISDNFRCPATSLVVANRVIKQNKQRQRKQLNLTKGFGGNAQLHFNKTVDEMACEIVTNIEQLKAEGRSFSDMAVLVRLNAQTPPIEQKLIAAKIPYRVSKPFYERPEIRVLVAYARLGWLESWLKSGKPLSSRLKEVWEESWSRVHNRPKRYINRELRQSIPTAVLRHNRPLSNVLFSMAESVNKDYLADKLEQFADTIEWLSEQMDQPASIALKSLDSNLGYSDYLRESTGSLQMGESRAISVLSFIDYAKDKGSLLQFMQHIKQLRKEKIGRNNPDGPVVTLSTIHQSKGLEWPIVIVPNCNQGIVPFTEMFTAQLDYQSHMEEERRLFYVAVTRTQEQLHLYLLKGEMPSQFIDEAHMQATLSLLDKLKNALSRDIADWRKLGAVAARDCQTVIRHANWLGLERYFQHYWDDEERLEIIGRFLRNTQRRNALKQLSITDSQARFWCDITPDVDGDFVGVERLLKQKRYPT